MVVGIKKFCFNRKKYSCRFFFSVKGGKYLTIGSDFHAGKFLKIEAWDAYNNNVLDHKPQIIIEDKVTMMDGCQLSAASRITIGSGCLFGSNVFITDNFHGDNSHNQLMIPPLYRALDIRGDVSIGKNVWLGRNVCIMPSVNIGDGAVIGANAVVTTDIPQYSIAVGVPAKVIKTIIK